MSMTGAAVVSAECGIGHESPTGVGLRLPHLTEVAAGAPIDRWLEVHPENVLGNPHARELLVNIAQRHAVSLHTVGLSAGSATGLDRKHLVRIRRLVDEVRPFLVSGHLAWSTHRGMYLNDLLPLPYNDESLRVVEAHVDEIQDAIGQPYIIENPASYVGFVDSTMTEAEFLAELVAATGCRLLCDVSNAFVSAANLGYDAYDYIDALPAQAVAELHLGGFTPEVDDAERGTEILIDTHAGAIAPPVWDLFAHALRRFGPRPALIEWDNDLPAFARLLAEAERADSVATAALARDHAHAIVG